MKVIKSRSNSRRLVRPVSKYQSKVLDKLQEREEFLRLQRAEKNAEKIDYLERRKLYGQYVKESYAPSGSSEKKQRISVERQDPDPVRLKISARRNNRSFASENIDTIIDYGFDPNVILRDYHNSEQTPVRKFDNYLMKKNGKQLNAKLYESPEISRSFKITPNPFTNRIINNREMHENIMHKQDVTNSVKVVNKYNKNLFSNENNKSRVSNDDYNVLKSEKITIKKPYNIPSAQKKSTKLPLSSEFDLKYKKKNVNFDNLNSNLSLGQESNRLKLLQMKNLEKHNPETGKKLENASQRFDNIFFNNVPQNKVLATNNDKLNKVRGSGSLKPW